MLALPAIRLATPADARAVAELSRDVIECGLGWNYTPARILAAVRSRVTNVAVMHEGGSLLAAGIMDYGDTSAHLVLLGVRREHRRRGLGRHLVDWLETCAVTAGLQTIGVEVRADNPGALAFYDALGYRLRDCVPGYYGGHLDAVRLTKTLFVRDGGGR